MSTFDVAIVGGGPAGAAAALHLRHMGATVLIVDAGKRLPAVGETLPPKANVLLAKLGLSERLERDGHRPCFGNSSAWGTGRAVVHDFIHEPFGHGWHLDRAQFDTMLRRAGAEAGAELRQATVTRVTRCAGTWSLEISRSKPRGLAAKEDQQRANWVIDASGRSSHVARRLGVRTSITDTLVAAVGWLRSPERQPMAGLTLTEARPEGWWYLAGLPGRTQVAALITDTRTASKLGVRKIPSWWHCLSQTELIARWVGPRADIVAGPRLVAAGSRQLAVSAGPGWIAVGDAAATFDPLASEGVNFALASGISAATAIAAHDRGRALADYREWVDETFDQYLHARAAVYARELRWPESPFWGSCRRRLGASHVLPR